MRHNQFERGDAESAEHRRDSPQDLLLPFVVFHSACLRGLCASALTMNHFFGIFREFHGYQSSRI